jgi:tRNA pseudouridine55 synthase
MTEGFLVLDKPSGRTSHDLVADVRRATGIKKVGHAGTLDPMATGIVVIAIDRCTRLIRFIQDQPKEYLATAVFGVATDSLDADGTETDRIEMEVDLDELRRVAAERFTGEIMQVPPMVSALKKDGRRLYDLAREGIEVEREARPVTIHEIEVLSAGEGPHPEVRFRVVCGKGTYVRSVADDLATALGGFAHLSALRRTTTGGATLADAITPDQLGEWEKHLRDVNTVLSDRPAYRIDDETAGRLRNGIRFRADDLPDVPFRVLGPGDEFIAMCERKGDQAVPMVVFN